MTRIIITGAGPLSESLKKALEYMECEEINEREQLAMEIRNQHEERELLDLKITDAPTKGPAPYRSNKAPRKW